eukprot:755259-Hanusia_phi.AAC.9
MLPLPLLLAGLGVPDPDGLVGGGGDIQAHAGADLGVEHGALVSLQTHLLRDRAEAPDLGEVVESPCDEPAPVPAELEGPDAEVVVPHLGRAGPAARGEHLRDLVDSDDSVVAGRHEEVIRVRRKASYAANVRAFTPHDHLGLVRVPQPELPVLAARHSVSPRGRQGDALDPHGMLFDLLAVDEALRVFCLILILQQVELLLVLGSRRSMLLLLLRNLTRDRVDVPQLGDLVCARRDQPCSILGRRRPEHGPRAAREARATPCLELADHPVPVLLLGRPDGARGKGRGGDDPRAVSEEAHVVHLPSVLVAVLDGLAAELPHLAGLVQGRAG